MLAAMQISQAVQPLDGQRHVRELPGDQQTVGVMMTDMLQIMAILGIIEPLVLNFPTTLGSVKQHPAANLFGRRVGEPERFNDLTVRFLLPVEQHAYGFPSQVSPRVEVPGIPKLDLIGAVTEGEFGRLGTETFLRRS